MARRSLDYARTLVITSRVPLIKQWKDEFGNAGRGVDYLCIQSAYKKKGHYDLVIVDEIHRSLSDKYSAVFENISYKYILGLTATVPEKDDALRLLDKYCPVVYRKEVHEAVAAGVLPEFEIINVAVGMDRKDKAKYGIFTTQFEQAAVELNRMRMRNEELRRKYASAFDMASSLKFATNDSPARRAARKFWSGMTMRKQVVYANPKKLEAVKLIIEKFPGKTWILFSKSISMAEEFEKMFEGRCKTYHSKMKTADREAVLEEFSNGKITILSAVDGLNEGLSVDGIDAGICVSGVSTILTNVQQLGRLLRTKEGKAKPIFFNLYTENTVEKTWVESKTINSKLSAFAKWHHITSIPDQG